MSDNNLSDEQIDDKLKLQIRLYDPIDMYPEWSNEDMRKAYRAGYRDGQND